MQDNPKRQTEMIRLHSFAKVNLGLEITGKRPDGYHTLKSVFQTVDLFDTVEISENSTGKINLSGDDPTIEWDERNTVSRAAEAMYQTYDLHRSGRGFDIFIRKKIPAGSGLGGGSSNAALIIMFLDRYFGLGADPNDLVSLAATVGADVPFFLLGGTVLAEGIGEKMTPQKDAFGADARITIAVPPVKVPTGLIFSRFPLTSGTIKSKIDTFMASGELQTLENDLEGVTFELFPEVGTLKESMLPLGYDAVMMSGSGSAVYGIAGGRNTPVVESPGSDADGDPIDGAAIGEMPTGVGLFEVRPVGREEYLERVGASPSGKASVFGADMRRFESSRPSTS